MHWPGANMALLGSVLMVVAVFIPILVRHAIKDKENQMQNFTILIFVLAFMAVNIMVFALRISKNVMHSMRVSAKENIMTSRLLANENALVLQAAQMDSTVSADRLDQARAFLVPLLTEDAGNVEGLGLLGCVAARAGSACRAGHGTGCKGCRKTGGGTSTSTSTARGGSGTSGCASLWYCRNEGG